MIEPGDVAVALADIGHDVPSATLTGLEIEGGVEQERPGTPGPQRRTNEVPALPGPLRRPGIHAEPGLDRTGGPHRGGPQCFGRLRSVDDPGLEGEDPYPRSGHLASPVGVGQIAHLLLQRQVDAPRHDPEEPVDDVDRNHRIRSAIVEGHGADPAETIRRRPPIPDHQPQPDVLFLEDHGVAEQALEHAASHRRARCGEWFPERRRLATGDRHHRDRPDPAPGQVQPVVGLVWKEAVRRLDPACGEPARAGQEHPQIGTADDRHEKRIHLVDGRNPVHLDPVHQLDAIDGHAGMQRLDPRARRHRLRPRFPFLARAHPAHPFQPAARGAHTLPVFNHASAVSWNRA